MMAVCLFYALHVFVILLLPYRLNLGNSGYFNQSECYQGRLSAFNSILDVSDGLFRSGLSVRCAVGVAPPAFVYNCRDSRLLFSSRVFRPRPPRSLSEFAVVAMLLAAGVEPNPGPPTTSVSLGLLNAKSVVSKAALVHDVISDLRLDVLMLTETWMTSDAPDAVKLDVASRLYQVIHQPRGSSTDKRGGGIAIVHRDSIKVRPFDVGTPAHPVRSEVRTVR